jgi:hypothetical protein
MEGRRRFRGEPLESLYNSWQSSGLDETTLLAQLSRVAPDRCVYFDTYLVKRQPPRATTDSREGERCAEEQSHQLVHP